MYIVNAFLTKQTQIQIKKNVNRNVYVYIEWRKQDEWTTSTYKYQRRRRRMLSSRLTYSQCPCIFSIWVIYKVICVGWRGVDVCICNTLGKHAAHVCSGQHSRGRAVLGPGAGSCETHIWFESFRMYIHFYSRFCLYVGLCICADVVQLREIKYILFLFYFIKHRIYTMNLYSIIIRYNIIIW